MVEISVCMRRNKVKNNKRYKQTEWKIGKGNFFKVNKKENL